MENTKLTPFKGLPLGGVQTANNTFLAPMAGITDTPFRLLCLKGGCGVVCAEMVSAEALKHDNQRSKQMLQADTREHPLSMQIFGSTPDAIALSAKLAEQAGADIIDINAGCPVKKINRSGAGCVLMKDEIKLGSLVAAAVKAVKKPVTLKTRIGLTAGNFIGDRLAKIAEDNGALAVVIHARWASDMHAGPIHHEFLAKTAAAVKIPVIGNGGIIDRATALAVLETGCKGVMIGRGAIGNPFIFEELVSGKPMTLPPQQKIQFYLDLIKENIKFYGPRTGVMRSRKTLGFWVSGFDGASALRSKFLTLEKIEEIEELFSEMLK